MAGKAGWWTKGHMGIDHESGGIVSRNLESEITSWWGFMVSSSPRGSCNEMEGSHCRGLCGLRQTVEKMVRHTCRSVRSCFRAKLRVCPKASILEYPESLLELAWRRSGPPSCWPSQRCYFCSEERGGIPEDTWEQPFTEDFYQLTNPLIGYQLLIGRYG